jgi:hypothetical protein
MQNMAANAAKLNVAFTGYSCLTEAGGSRSREGRGEQTWRKEEWATNRPGLSSRWLDATM